MKKSIIVVAAVVMLLTTPVMANNVPKEDNVCWSCGTAIVENANYCYSCGSSVQYRCNNCGKIISPEANICTFCGAKQEKNQHDNMERIVCIGILIPAILLAIWGLDKITKEKKEEK